MVDPALGWPIIHASRFVPPGTVLVLPSLLRVPATVSFPPLPNTTMCGKTEEGPRVHGYFEHKVFPKTVLPDVFYEHDHNAYRHWKYKFDQPGSFWMPSHTMCTGDDRCLTNARKNFGERNVVFLSDPRDGRQLPLGGWLRFPAYDFTEPKRWDLGAALGRAYGGVGPQQNQMLDYIADSVLAATERERFNRLNRLPTIPLEREWLNSSEVLIDLARVDTEYLNSIVNAVTRGASVSGQLVERTRERVRQGLNAVAEMRRRLDASNRELAKVRASELTMRNEARSILNALKSLKRLVDSAETPQAAKGA